MAAKNTTEVQLVFWTTTENVMLDHLYQLYVVVVWTTDSAPVVFETTNSALVVDLTTICTKVLVWTTDRIPVEFWTTSRTQVGVFKSNC